MGWQQFAPKPVPPTVITVTPTATTVTGSQTVVATTSYPRSFKIFGRIFFDYNGNGRKEIDEPDMSGVPVAIDGKNVTTTNSTGWYLVTDIATGNHTVRPFPPKNFRYMCESAAEYRSVKDHYMVSVANDTQKDIGLMEGFLTVPFSRMTKHSIGRCYDWDQRIGRVEWWNGKTYEYINRQGIGADDDHTGIDFDAKEGEQVLAPAPGTVVFAGLGPNPESLVVDIQHDYGFKTSYNHLSKILVSAGQRVERGEAIGLVGATGTFYPHLHFELYQPWSQGPVIFDPYRPTFKVTDDRSGCWALKAREKYWLRLPADQNPNLFGYWTKENDPQFYV